MWQPTIFGLILFAESLQLYLILLKEIIVLVLQLSKEFDAGTHLWWQSLQEA